MSATQLTSDPEAACQPYRPPHRAQCVLLLVAYAILTFFFAGNVLSSQPEHLVLVAAFAFWGAVSVAAIGIAVGLWTGHLQPDDP